MRLFVTTIPYPNLLWTLPHDYIYHSTSLCMSPVSVSEQDWQNCGRWVWSGQHAWFYCPLNLNGAHIIWISLVLGNSGYSIHKELETSTSGGYTSTTNHNDNVILGCQGMILNISWNRTEVQDNTTPIPPSHIKWRHFWQQAYCWPQEKIIPKSCYKEPHSS